MRFVLYPAQLSYISQYLENSSPSIIFLSNVALPLLDATSDTRVSVFEPLFCRPVVRIEARSCTLAGCDLF